jgi:hypothetical protein
MNSMKTLMLDLLKSFLGIGFLPKANISGAILIVGGAPWSNAQRGVENNETGINISRFSCRYYLAVNEKLPSNVGEPIARAQSDKFSRDIKLAGEVLVGGGGVMAFTMAAACTLANDVAVFSPTAGTILLDEVTESQERAGWRSLDMSLSSDPGLVI